MDYTLIDIIAQGGHYLYEHFGVKDPYGKDIPIWSKYDFVNNNSQFILKAYAYTDPKNKLEIQAGFTDDSTTRFATFSMPDEVKLNLEEGRIYIEYDFTFDISNVVGYNKEYKLNGTIRTNYGIYNSSKSQLSSGSNNSYEVYELQQTVKGIYQEQLNKENNVTEEDYVAVIKKQYPGAEWILEPSDMYNTNTVYVPADYFGKASGGHYFAYGGYRDFERYGNSYTPFTVKIDSNIAKIWHEGGHPDASPFGVNHVDLTVTYSDSDPDNPAYDLLGMVHTCNLFKECYSLERVNWNGTLNIYNNTDNMFYGCYNLVHIDVKNMGPITDSLHLNETQLTSRTCQKFINALTSSEHSGLPAWGERMKTLWLSHVVSLSDVDCSNVPEDWDVCDTYGNHLREQSMPEPPVEEPEEPELPEEPNPIFKTVSIELPLTQSFIMWLSDIGVNSEYPNYPRIVANNITGTKSLKDWFDDYLIETSNDYIGSLCRVSDNWFDYNDGDRIEYYISSIEDPNCFQWEGFGQISKYEYLFGETNYHNYLVYPTNDTVQEYLRINRGYVEEGYDNVKYDKIRSFTNYLN